MRPVEWTVPRLRWILPLAQLLLCALILWPLRHEIVMQSRGKAFPMSANQVQYLLDHGTKFNFISEQSQKEALLRERPLWIPSALNLPVMFVELPYAIFSNDQDELKPRSMNFLYWRALSWPLVGIVFWWLAGRGIEALLAGRAGIVAPRLNWTETIFNILFVLCGGLTGLVMLCDESSHVRGFDAGLFPIGGLLWAAFGSIGIMARIMQWRLRRTLQAANTAIVVDEAS